MGEANECLGNKCNQSRGEDWAGGIEGRRSRLLESRLQKPITEGETHFPILDDTDGLLPLLRGSLAPQPLELCAGRRIKSDGKSSTPVSLHRLLVCVPRLSLGPAPAHLGERHPPDGLISLPWYLTRDLLII